MFNLQHILYMVISFSLTGILLALAARYVQDEKKKIGILKFFAIFTVFLHYSNLWVDYFTTGTAQIANNQILPVYPCNIVMWMLLIAACMRNKQGLLFQMLGEFCLLCGTLCGVVGIVFNINFGNNPNLADYEIFKGMISHSTMVFGCLYLGVGKFVRVRMFNMVSLTAGLGIFVLCGILVNRLYDAFGMEAPDGIFLRSNPYLPVPTVVAGLGALLLVFGILSLLELRLPREQRWYHRLRRESKK